MTLTPQQLNIEIAHILGYSNIGATYPRREPGRGETNTPATEPRMKADCYLPDYAGDIGAAATLIPLISKPGPDGQEGNYLVLTHCWTHGWRADLMFAHHDGDAIQHSVSAPTLALAIAAAFYYETVRSETPNAIEGVTINEVED